MKFYCGIASSSDPKIEEFKRIIEAPSFDDAVGMYIIAALNQFTAEGMPGPLAYVSNWGHGCDIVKAKEENPALEIPKGHGFGVWIHHKVYQMELHEEAETIRKKFWPLIEIMRFGKTGGQKIDPSEGKA